jgi:hypothetical protein
MDQIQEAKWRTEFEKAGPQYVNQAIWKTGQYPSQQRDIAIGWLREKELESDRLDRSAQWYLKWTFWAAVLAATSAVLTLVGSPFGTS